MKKMLAYLIIAVLACAMSGCGRSVNSTHNELSNTQAERRMEPVVSEVKWDFEWLEEPWKWSTMRMNFWFSDVTEEGCVVEWQPSDFAGWVAINGERVGRAECTFVPLYRGEDNELFAWYISGFELNRRADPHMYVGEPIVERNFFYIGKDEHVESRITLPADVDHLGGIGIRVMRVIKNENSTERRTLGTVPDFTGLNFDEMVEKYSGEFTLTMDREFNEEYPAGQIISQFTNPGDLYRVGTASVKVVVSKGTGVFPIPDYRNYTLHEYADLLDTKGVKYRFDSAVANRADVKLTNISDGSMIVGVKIMPKNSRNTIEASIGDTFNAYEHYSLFLLFN